MTDEKFKEIMDSFFNCSIEEYLHSILKDFSRFSSNFQLLSIENKLKSHYLTSLNIKYGYALEAVFKEYLMEKGAIFLNRDIVEGKDCDQIFIFNGKYVLIEQKVRDDHDSSKKVGQVENYLEKKKYLIENFSNVKSCCWFIDSEFHKNKKYYEDKLSKEELFYGKEIEDFLEEIFEDKRCNNFYEWISNKCLNYQKEIVMLDNFSIDFHKFSVTEIYNLLSNENIHAQIAEIFFNGKIPYVEILEYVKTQRKVPKKETLISMLEEIINGK